MTWKWKAKKNIKKLLRTKRSLKMILSLFFVCHVSKFYYKCGSKFYTIHWWGSSLNFGILRILLLGPFLRILPIRFGLTAMEARVWRWRSNRRSGLLLACSLGVFARAVLGGVWSWLLLMYPSTCEGRKGGSRQVQWLSGDGIDILCSDSGGSGSVVCRFWWCGAPESGGRRQLEAS